MQKKNKVYYARIIPASGIFDVCELTVRTVANTWFVGIDKHDKHAYLINNDQINRTVFTDRKLALEKAIDASRKTTPIISNVYYEDYQEETYD